MTDASVVPALRRACALLTTSQDSDWTPWSAAEIRDELAAMVAALEAGGAIDADRLRLLFIPAGPVQETAMANDWSGDLHEIARVVDAYLGDG